MIGLFFRFCLRLSTFHWIISDGVISGVGRKWEHSDSSDSESVKLMTSLKTPIFDFRYVISALTTPTPSLLKTSLKEAQTSSAVSRNYYLDLLDVHNFFM